jgi:hypothetical protein
VRTRVKKKSHPAQKKFSKKNRTPREKNSAKKIAPRAKKIQQICGTFKITAINTDPPIIKIFPK